MVTSVNASNGSTSGLIQTGDASGVLQLQVNNGTPALTLNTTQALGVGSSPSYGTSGQVLQSTGSGSAPTWATPATGAMTLISTQTASSSTSLQWTGLSGYSSYLIIGSNLVPSANYVYAMLQFGTGATPTWQTSSYVSGGGYVNPPASAGQSGGGTGFSLDLQYGPTISAGQPTQDFVANLFNINSTIAYKGITWQTTVPAISTYQIIGASGKWQSTTQVTAVRILAESSGNFVSGSASLYGISS